MLVPFNATIWLYRRPVDFRKQIDGLMVLVADTLECNPASGQLFVFRNRQADKIKMLYWQDNGFWLLYKRNESGRFIFPPIVDGTMTLSTDQLHWLLSGIDFMHQVPAKTLRPTRFF